MTSFFVENGGPCADCLDSLYRTRCSLLLAEHHVAFTRLLAVEVAVQHSVPTWSVSARGLRAAEAVWPDHDGLHRAWNQEVPLQRP